MTELIDLSIAEAREGLKRKEFSATELARAHLPASRLRTRRLTPMCCRRPNARSRWRRRATSASRRAQAGALEGIPLGIKDLFATKGVRTTACSHILDGFTPTYESTVTANLWAAGAVMLGKLNNDEFAMGSSNETSYYGPVVNPWRREGLDAEARARRVVGRLIGGGGGAALHGGHRDRHRRLDPPARGVHRHRRHQADLRALLALGHRRLRLLARPGGADRADRARRGDPAGTMAGHDPKDTTSVECRCRTTRPRSARA